MNKRDNIIKWSIISVFVGLYALVSTISTIHVIDFFRLSNPDWLAITLAIAFEIGAAASLAAIVILDKTSRALVWMLFILITLMQMSGNMYYAYVHLKDYQAWVELFGLIEEEPIFQKRILSIVSGAILPIVALGFIKSLVDYIRPTKPEEIIEKTEKEIQKEAIIDLMKSDEESGMYETKAETLISEEPNPHNVVIESVDPQKEWPPKEEIQFYAEEKTEEPKEEQEQKPNPPTTVNTVEELRRVNKMHA
jgi:hypothetical protein